MEYSSRVKQIKIYFGKRGREFQNTKKLIKTIVSTLVIGLMLLLILGDSMMRAVHPSLLRFFILACACIFYGLFNSLESVCSEREIIKHEHRSGMYLSSYILGYAAFDFFVCLVHALVTWLVVMVRYFGVIREQNGSAAPLHAIGYLLTMILLTFSADAMGLFVSSVVKTSEQAIKMMPFVMILQVAFGGIFFDLPALISSLTLSRWGTYAMFDTGFERRPEFEQIATLKNYPSFPACWFALLIYTVVFLALAILFLQNIDKDQR